MDALSIQPALVQTQPVQPKQAPVLPNAAAPTLPQVDNSDQGSADAQIIAAGQKRVEAVQIRAQAIANANILGTTTFAIFEDARGVLITRIHDKNTGKTSYIPEPQMLKLGDSAPAVLNITA